MANKDDSLALTEWVKRGDMIVRREALGVTDPESWPTKWQEKFGDLDGFPWRKIYGDASPSARAEWGREMRRKHGDSEYCPHCGNQLW
jgi:hypothetical protein